MLEAIMQYPKGKRFAFTIIDDTDGDIISNTRPVYEFLIKMGFKTTKTVWTLPPKDAFKGFSLSNYHYRQHINKLQREGVEIALHGVSSGRNTRQDILDGLEIYKKFIGKYPKIQINHAQNPDNLYWGLKRFTLFKPFWYLSNFKGENPESIYFWGDYAKKNIKYIRNFTFDNLNTLKKDKFMPYKDSSKEYVNYWFSSSDGSNPEKYNKLVNQENIDSLVKEGGTAIIFTHFASGFYKKGYLDRTFQKNMTYLSRQNGWFAPAGEILDFILEKKGKELNLAQKISLEFKWLLDKVI